MGCCVYALWRCGASRGAAQRPVPDRPRSASRGSSRPCVEEAGGRTRLRRALDAPGYKFCPGDAAGA
jgi:hypothetical protein